MRKADHQSGKAAGTGKAEPPQATIPLRPQSYTAEELADLERRERLSGWLVLFFAGAAIATALLAFYLFADDVEQNDQFVRSEDQETKISAESETTFIWGQAGKDLETAPEEDEVQTERLPPPSIPKRPSTEVRTVSEEQIFNFPGPPADNDVPTFSGPPVGSVDRETSRALRSGKAQIWREGGERGYVLVSDPVSYGSRECRQVSYSRFDDGPQAISLPNQWCRVDKSGKWQPDSRGPQ